MSSVYVFVSNDFVFKVFNLVVKKKTLLKLTLVVLSYNWSNDMIGGADS